MEDNKKNIITPVIPNDLKNTVFKTYTGDIAEVIEHDTQGLVKKIIHGEEIHEKEKKNYSPLSRKNKIFTLIGVVLFLVAILILLFLFFKRSADVVPAQKQFVPIIFNDQAKQLEISGLQKDKIEQTVLGEVNADKVANGGVAGIYLTENGQNIGLRRLISLIDGSFVPSNSTLLVSDNFLMGVAGTGVAPSGSASGNGFFILMKVNSMQDVFSSLRNWESTMLTDLHGFLGVNISSGTNYLFAENFTDGVIQNKNARILYDKNNNIVLMYIFADDNSVVITDSQDAATEVMNRLAASQTTQ